MPQHTQTTRQPVPPVEPDLTVIDRLVAEIGTGPENLLALLQAVQDQWRYLPREALERLCDRAGLSPARVLGVATFYNQFRLRPAGRHTVNVCHGTACYVAGAAELTAALRRHLKLEDGEDTDAARLFTLQEVACLGCCSLAPVVQVDDRIYGHVTPGTVGQIVDDFLAHCEDRDDETPGPVPVPGTDGVVAFRIGLDSSSIASGSGAVREALQREIRRTGAAAVVQCVGCTGICHCDPLVEVSIPGGGRVFYANVAPTHVPALVRRHAPPANVTRRLLAAAQEAAGFFLGIAEEDTVSELDPRSTEVREFLAPQRRIVLEHAGRADPTDLELCREQGAWQALEHVLLAGDPQALIATVRESGLRGRGGAGFPTGQKWQYAREAEGTPKYVVCNGDEGDPGAFMDRMILESFPYRVLEGMALAAFATGASKGYVYVRAEYPLAASRLEEALDRARDAGLLGNSVMGSGFAFDVEIVKGAGAFVSGEETALMASIEGRRATPRFRPPYPATSGLYGQPTVVNNVETLAALPWIVRHGPEAFRQCGTEACPGTKVFALAGPVRRGGLIEVPMGIRLRTIVDEIAGGMNPGRRLKGVLIGGPSGGCLPEHMLDLPVDFEALNEAGAIMGSGGLVILDQTACMVDVARYFLQFTQNESCGKCTFCRIGTKRMLGILEQLCAGHATHESLERLEALAKQVQTNSLCGLGRTAPNPVLSALRYFREEFEAHVNGHCPAGVCSELFSLEIGEACIGCTICAQHCPVDAIDPKPYERHRIDQERCVRCGTCRRICPAQAVAIRERTPSEPPDSRSESRLRGAAP